ncbi:MAG: hypothetical protein D6772_00845 [Bacteroidetes bacterium]|nr:MAG: hypothetical protein D6772_00845 [Bacteroidota bacterium]
MRKSTKLALLLLTLIGLAGLFIWLHPLPFQRAHPLAAVGQSQPLLVALPDSLSMETPYSWRSDLLRRNQLLDSLQLNNRVRWTRWWLLPTRGETGEAIYTFIGEAEAGLDKYWNPQSYGPTLPFGGGDIYTFAYTTEAELFYARYCNLLLIGRYPFQLEAALRRLTTNTDNWAELPAWQALLTEMALAPAEAALLLYPPALNVDLPTDWLSPAAIRQWQQLEAVQLTFAEYSDSSAFLRWQAVPQVHIAPSGSLPWQMVPPDVTTVWPLVHRDSAGSKAFDQVWALQLPIGRTEYPRAEPNLWVAELRDTATWSRLRNAAELIDYEDYQTYRMEQWRDFPLLGRWTGRRGILQAWTLKMGDQVAVALEREVLERWLDLQLLGVNMALEPYFADFLTREDPAVALLSWSAAGAKAHPQTGGRSAPPLLATLFPTASWAVRGMTVLTAEELSAKRYSGSAQIMADPRQVKGLQLRWTAPLPTTAQLSFPVQRMGDMQISGWLLGRSGQTGQLFRGIGPGERLPLPEGCIPGPVFQLAEAEPRYLITTNAGIVLLSEDGQAQVLPGSIGLSAAAPAQIQARGNNWEWLLVSRKGQVCIGDAAAQLVASWTLSSVDSLADVDLWWQRDATTEQVIFGNAAGKWQAYTKQGELQWEAPYPTTPAAGPAAGLFSAEDERLYLPQIDGKVQVLNRAGEHFTLAAGRGPVDHALVGQWWGDARADVVLQRGNLVHLFGYEGSSFQERWQYRLPVVPDTLIIAAELGVMAVHRTRQQLWLLDGEGQLAAGFPITGSDQAQLIHDEAGQPILLVVADDEVYAYELR